MIKEVIVVEGRDDTVAIRRAVEADTIETGGSAINQRILKRIALAQERRGVIVLTDPDHAGERIRKIIANKVPGRKHAFIPEADATRKGDIGVENASPEAIRHALARVHTSYEGAPSLIDWEDLIAAGLIVHPQVSRDVAWRWAICWASDIVTESSSINVSVYFRLHGKNSLQH